MELALGARTGTLAVVENMQVYLAWRSNKVLLEDRFCLLTRAEVPLECRFGILDELWNPIPQKHQLTRNTTCNRIKGQTIQDDPRVSGSDQWDVQRVEDDWPTLGRSLH